MEFYVLPRHAAQCLGIDPGALDLPRCGDGFDADALWIDPRFREVVRQREAIARQMAERRFNVELHKCSPRTPEEVKVMKRRERKKLRAAKRKRLAQARVEVV